MGDFEVSQATILNIPKPFQKGVRNFWSKFYH